MEENTPLEGSKKPFKALSLSLSSNVIFIGRIGKISRSIVEITQFAG